MGFHLDVQSQDDLIEPEFHHVGIRGFGFEKGLIVTGGFNLNLFLSARNIPGLNVTEARSLSPVELVHSEKVLVTAEALNQIQESLS